VPEFFPMKSVLLRFRPIRPILAVVVLLVAMSGDPLIAKKVVAHLLMPAGLLWMALFAAVAWPGLPRAMRMAALGFFAAYSLAGSPYAGVWLLRLLEKPFYEVEQPSKRFDALVVLGGGTAMSPGGRPALGNHGDRITRPAVLFHEGLVGTLITTGRSITEDSADRLLSRETSLLWQAMGIPADRIIEISEPRNTAEELAAVAKLAKEHPEWKRIGLGTSASHLPRALDEAEAQGLAMIPVPSDFRSGPMIFSPMYLIPQGRGFRDVQAAMWEFLGRMF
jgi:uncharacterized SAM-binding protein YcdF (DUF218 family)